MAGRPQPRRITLAGREAVALPPKEHEQLIAGREQFGGRSVRVRVLAQQAKRTARLVHDLERLTTDPFDGCPDRTGRPRERCTHRSHGSHLSDGSRRGDGGHVARWATASPVR